MIAILIGLELVHCRQSQKKSLYIQGLYQVRISDFYPNLELTTSQSMLAKNASIYLGRSAGA